MPTPHFVRAIPLVLCLATIAATGGAVVHAATSPTLKARISGVTAFDDGAVISFGGKVTLEEGDTIVTFADLPVGFTLENARITGYGRARVTLHDARLDGGSGRAPRRLRLFCEVRRAGEFGFNVAYRDGPVFWQPDYVVRVDTAKQKLSIEYAALITQTTRDAWRDVSLTILPHRQGRGGTLPQQEPWQLALSEKPEPTPEHPDMQDEWWWLSRDDQFDEVAWGFAEPEELDLHHAESAKVFRRSLMPGGSAWVTNGERPVSVRADGQPQRVVFATKTFDCAIRQVVWPKLAQCVYRVAEMRNNSYVPLVAGDAEVFVDGVSLGRLRLESVEPCESLTINLGVDAGFLVQRPRSQVQSDPSRDSPQLHRGVYETKTTIESRHTVRQVVEVRDELPRSSDPALVVEMVPPESFGATTTSAASESERCVPVVTADGSITWSLTFEPGQKWELPLKLVVTWPADQHVLPWRFW